MNKEEFLKFMSISTEKEMLIYFNNYLQGTYLFDSIKHEISFLYNLGLFFSDLYSKAIQQDIFRNEDKYYNAPFCYLKAIQIYEANKLELDSDWDFIYEIIRRCYVNLGNEYSNQFRTIDALRYFRKALDIDKFFDMAIGNFAHCIERHPVFFEFNESDKIFNLLLELYDDIHIEELDSGQEFFTNKKERYNYLWNSYVESIKAGQDPHYSPENFLEEFINEGYEGWCVRNTLVLNPVNDIGNYVEAQMDMDFNYIVLKLGLKNEKALLKHMYDLYIHLRKKIFLHKDIDNIYNVYEIELAFNSLYSFFDKTAFWLYKYFNLNFKDESKVNILSIWGYKTNTGVSLLDYKNQFLYNIYWLRKEYRQSKKDDLEINQLLSPDAQNYSNLRNILEHRGYGLESTDEEYINPSDLLSKTLRLASVIRNLILSIVFMVDVENKLITDGKRNLDLVFFQFEGF